MRRYRSLAFFVQPTDVKVLEKGMARNSGGGSRISVHPSDVPPSPREWGHVGFPFDPLR